MPYGQVTTPSATLTHVHSNAVGQGGSLDGTTLIRGAPLFALMVGLS